MIDETAKGSNDQSKDIEIQEMANEIKEELGPTTVATSSDNGLGYANGDLLE